MWGCIWSHRLGLHWVRAGWVVFLQGVGQWVGLGRGSSLVACSALFSGKENLFQISCADIVERFQIFMYILIMLVQDLRGPQFGGAQMIHVMGVYGCEVSPPPKTPTDSH